MTCPDCANTGYVMQDIGTATVPDYVEIRCRCNPEPTEEERTYFYDALGWDEREDGTYGPTDDEAPNWLDDPDFIIEGESVLYVPKGWPDDFGHPGETPDCPFDPTPPDQPNYLYGTE